MQRIIRKNSVLPAYQQLQDWMRGAISQGTLLPGQRLPSENEFSRQCGIHRNTVRAALDGLAKAGLICSVSGSGWFVRQHEEPTQAAGLLILRDPDNYHPSRESDFSVRLRRGLAEGAEKYRFCLREMASAEWRALLTAPETAARPEALIVTEFHPDYLPILRRLQATGVPLVLCNRKVFGEDIPSVSVDQYYGPRDLVARLLQQGHRRIGYITVTLSNQWQYALERYRGYADALTAQGVTTERRLVCQISDPERCRRKIREFIRRNRDLTALFIAGESFHHVTLAVLRRAGVCIPEDLSVVAFDRVRGDWGVRIVSLDQPLEEVGRRVFRTLDAVKRGETVPGEVLLPSIIQGDSLGAPRSGAGNSGCTMRHIDGGKEA